MNGSGIDQFLKRFKDVLLIVGILWAASSFFGKISGLPERTASAEAIISKHAIAINTIQSDIKYIRLGIDDLKRTRVF